MSKELTTEQKLMQATQYGLLIYAGQRKIHDEDERLKLEKICKRNRIVLGTGRTCSRLSGTFEEITLPGLCRYAASEMQYTHGETEVKRIKRSIGFGNPLYVMKKHWSE